MEKKIRVSFMWTLSMLLLWVNGFVLTAKGRKLKISIYTITGIILTAINFLVPIICLTTSNDNLMGFLTILWFTSPIVALIIALREKNEYIYKMSLVKLAKKKNIKCNNIDELKENCNTEISIIEKPVKQKHRFSNILLAIIGAFILFVLILTATSTNVPTSSPVTLAVEQNEIIEKKSETALENNATKTNDDVNTEAVNPAENKKEDVNKVVTNEKAQKDADTNGSLSPKEKNLSDASKKAETKSEKSKVECHIFIRYNISLLTGKEKDSEIAVLFNDMEVDKLNEKDAKEYIVFLPEGKNTITLKRKWYDKEKVEIEIPANSDNNYNLSLEYTYSTIKGAGSVELTGPDFTSDAYTWREKNVKYEE